jgi:hypothetical protein
MRNGVQRKEHIYDWDARTYFIEIWVQGVSQRATIGAA